MQLAAALLCDAASVREGLLNILGGGISVLGRPSFPAALNVELALMISIHPSELDDAHQLRVVVNGEDGENYAAVDGRFGPAQIVGPAPRQEVLQPLVLSLRQVGVPKPGSYSIEITVDKQHHRSLPFAVTEAQPSLFPDLPPQV